MHTETVFEILGEGGGITIERKTESGITKFLLHHSEFDPTESGMDINRQLEFDAFEDAFAKIYFKFPWYALHLETVHKDFHDFVKNRLVEILTEKAITPEDIAHSRIQINKVFGEYLVFDFAPLDTGLLNIRVANLVKLTEYDYREYTPEAAAEKGRPWRVKGRYEVYSHNDHPYGTYLEIVNGEYEFNTLGTLEFSGSTILIRGKGGYVQYAFSSDKYFVSAKPVLSRHKSWFWREG